jgi:hypothetical protein
MPKNRLKCLDAPITSGDWAKVDTLLVSVNSYQRAVINALKASPDARAWVKQGAGDLREGACYALNNRFKKAEFDLRIYRVPHDPKLHKSKHWWDCEIQLYHVELPPNEAYDYRNIGWDASLLRVALGLSVEETAKLFGFEGARDQEHLTALLDHLPVDEARMVVLRLQLGNGINLLLEKIGLEDPEAKRKWLEHTHWQELNGETGLAWITSGDFTRLEQVCLLLQRAST